MFVSLLGWVTWYFARGPWHPYGDLSNGYYSDHFSHLNTVRLFFKVGTAIYKRPTRELAHIYTEDEKRLLPADIQPAAEGEIFWVDGWSKDKPIIASWSTRPRYHPPGDILLFGPVAALYQFTSISFTWANRLLIVLCLIYAHVSLYVILRQHIGASKRTSCAGPLAALFLYGQLVYWSLNGFYEVADIAPLVLTARYLCGKRWLSAIVSYTVAAFIHFRAFFFAPLVVYAAVQLIAEQRSFRWTARRIAALLVATVLAFGSLGTFALLWPTLKTLSSTEPFSVHALIHNPAVLVHILVGSLCAAIFVARRAWLDLAVMLWVSIMLARLPEFYPWDILSLLAWLGMAVATGGRSSARDRSVEEGRLIFVIYVGALFFQNTMLPTWLQVLFR